MTPWEWHAELFDQIRKLGMVAFSTAHDETAVDFLKTLRVPAYKVASFENNDLPSIRKVSRTGKPVIVFMGMASGEEMEEAVSAARSAGCKELILLKCISAYPSDPKHANLLTVPDMSEKFRCPIGLSDHTPGIGTAVASVAFGVVLIEKHFTLSHRDDGVDFGHVDGTLGNESVGGKDSTCETVLGTMSIRAYRSGTRVPKGSEIPVRGPEHEIGGGLYPRKPSGDPAWFGSSPKIL